MIKVAYFDCFGGASGDMILGALLDAGLELAQLKSELHNLKLAGFDLKAEAVSKKSIGGTQATVVIQEEHQGGHHHHRNLKDITDIIEQSELAAQVKTKSLEIFRRLALAEAKVHRIAVDKVHFHEVGALDTIVDVVGSVAGLEMLGIEQIFCSPMHLGRGTVECAHGTLPVPAPATSELLKGKPVYATEVEGELVTPTGAAILTTLACDFGPMPLMEPESIGYGAGNAERSIPNLLRVIIGRGLEKEQRKLLGKNLPSPLNAGGDNEHGSHHGG